MSVHRDPFDHQHLADAAELAESRRGRLFCFRQAQDPPAGVCGCGEQHAAPASPGKAARHGDADPALDRGRARVRLAATLAGPGRTLVIEGELDVATAPLLHDAVTGIDWRDPSLEPGDALLLDLSAVTFIDTSGAHALNDIHAYVAAHGVRLQVIPPAGRGPRRLVQFAVTTGLLARPFASEDPAFPLGDGPGGPGPTPRSWAQASRRTPG